MMDPLEIDEIPNDQILPLADLADIDLCLDQFADPGDDRSPFRFGDPVEPDSGSEQPRVQAWLIHPTVYAVLHRAAAFVGYERTDDPRTEQMRADLADKILHQAPLEPIAGLSLVDPSRVVSDLAVVLNHIRSGTLAPVVVGRDRTPEGVLDGTDHYRELVFAYNEWQLSDAYLNARPPDSLPAPAGSDEAPDTEADLARLGVRERLAEIDGEPS